MEVRSIRKIRWDSFRPNFFLVFPPGLLDGAAGTYMTSVFLTPAQRPALADLVSRFPTVSVFDVDAILQQIREIMDRASLAVQYVFPVHPGRGRRGAAGGPCNPPATNAVMKAPCCAPWAPAGARCCRGVAAEFSALGFLSGTLAAFGATAVGWVLARRSVFSALHARSLGVGGGTGVRHVLVGLSGTLATRRVVQHAADSHPAGRVRRGARRRAHRTSRISQAMGMGLPRNGSASMRTL